MTIFEWIKSLAPEERARLVGGRDWGVMHLEELTLKQAGELVALCPANLAYAMFDDDRGCPNKADCRRCTRNFLQRQMMEVDDDRY